MPAQHAAQPTDVHLVWGKPQDRTDRRFKARAAVVEQLMSKWTKPDWTGVDVSGGAGRWLSTLAPRFSRFTHLDLSPDALDVARAEHPDLVNVEYGRVDLLNPVFDRPARTWDAAFCLDTLLYRGDFVEMVLGNIRSFVRPGGIFLVDVPSQFRASISKQIKGSRYGGPERKFSPRAAYALAHNSGYEILDTAYHFSELTTPIHRHLAERGLTRLVPWPSTWMYLVLRVTDRPS